jgi:hypothetical protein
MIVRDIVLIHITTAGDEYGTPTKLRTRFAEELFAREYSTPDKAMACWIVLISSG